MSRKKSGLLFSTHQYILSVQLPLILIEGSSLEKVQTCDCIKRRDAFICVHTCTYTYTFVHFQRKNELLSQTFVLKNLHLII